MKNLFLLLLLVSASLRSAVIPESSRHLAPDFTLRDMQGNNVTLSSLRGQHVLLNFWATWCVPCKAEMPWFEEFSKTYAPRGLRVLGVSVDTDATLASIQKFLTDLRVTYPNVWDSQEITTNLFSVDALPTTLILDPQGRIAVVYNRGLEERATYVSDIENVLRGSDSRPEISAVVNGASFKGGIAGNTWITITGKGLASGSRSWSGADFKDGKLPTALDGVSVSVNGKPAYVAFISPGQINALTGQEPVAGPIPVTVTTGAGTSQAYTASMQSVSPGLFVLPYGNAAGNYVAAHTPEGVYIGPANLIPGVVTRPARPNEILSVYGTGFGPVTGPAPESVLVTAPSTLVANVSLRFGDIPAQVLYAGQISNGLYQFNIRVPQLLPGTYALSVEVAGVATLAVQIAIAD